MNPVYKTFSTIKDFYVFDRSTNSILNLTKEEYGLLNQKDNETIMKFQKNGYLNDNTLKRIKHHDTDHLEHYHRNNLALLVIQLTQNCNLRCSYCPYMGGYDNRTHSDKTIDIKTIRKGIDYLFSHSRNIRQVSIGFYGGEPLLEMPLLKEAVAYIESMKEGRTVRLTLTTNGTLLSDAHVEYFMEKNIRVLLSLDGAREYHNANRVFPGGEGSFDVIMQKLMAIQQKYPLFFQKLSVNSVINTNNDLSCSNDFFNAEQVLEQLIVNMNLVNENNAKKEIKYNEAFSATHDYETCKAYLNMIGRISNKQVSKLYRQNAAGTHLLYKTLRPFKMEESVQHPGGPCLPGVARLFMDVDGNLYPCERVSEQSEIMRFGHIDSGIDLSKAKYLLNIGSITEQECLNCFAFHQCKACCACADGHTELSRDKKLLFCRNVKNTVLEEMRLITMLKEFNYHFEELAYE